MVESKEVQKIIVQKAPEFLPKGFKKCRTLEIESCEYGHAKIEEFENSFLVRHLLPLMRDEEAASQENMIAVFESKEFKSTVVKI